MPRSKTNPLAKQAKQKGKTQTKKVQQQVSTRGQPPKTNVRKG